VLKDQMRISVLTDNQPGSLTLAEHGLSYIIEYDNKKILFDTGQTDVFIRNAEKKGIDISDINVIVLSHGHYDHGNGLSHLKGGNLICHPGCFIKRYRKNDQVNIGLKKSQDELSKIFKLTLSAEPYKISEKIIFLGEIPRVTDFESKSTNFVLEDGSPDFIQDDSGVVLLMAEGLFIVTGCGHSGVVNTFEHAKAVTGVKDLYGIMGGFHLKQKDHQTKETIEYLRKNNVKHIYPSHCTELPALAAFYEIFGIKQVKTGDILNF